MISAWALALLLAQDLLAQGLPPRQPSIPEFLNPATAYHEIIVQCGSSSGVVRWRVAPTFHMDEFVLDRFVASEADLAPINEAVGSFGDQSAVVVRCSSSGAILSIHSFQDPRKREVHSFFFNRRGFEAIR